MTIEEILLAIEGYRDSENERRQGVIVQAWLTAGLIGRLLDKHHPFPSLKDLLADFEPSKKSPQIPRAEQEAEAKKLNLKGPWA